MEQPNSPPIRVLGNSPKMKVVLSSMRKVAASDIPVLLLGEKGTGKRLIARTIHQLSSRVEDPFILVNCDSIPNDLTEVEFFDNVEKAFTDKHAREKRHINRSNRGTLFLNDVHALPLSLQAALIHYMDEKHNIQMDAFEAVRMNAQIIASSDQDLLSAVHKGQFRDDLYFSFVKIPIPPLRSRRGDILQLAHGFLDTYAVQNGRKAVGFSNNAEDAMSAYKWPGNVRELENRVKIAVVMAEGVQITPMDLELPEATLTPRKAHSNLKDAREALEKKLIMDAVIRWKGNVTEAAEELGLSRPTLYDLMTKHGIPRK